MNAQFTDPAVSREKFVEEMALFRALEDEYRKRGWILQKAEFPIVHILMAAPQLKPAAVILGVRFDYTNYDAEPPSVRLVDPFTWEAYKAKDLPTTLQRQSAPQALVPTGMGPEAQAQIRMMIPQATMQAYGPEEIPFMCLAGVREYHDHPAHSGDSWELHRPQRAGRLVHLLDFIHRIGIVPITQYNVALLPQVTLTPSYVPE